jgi:ABC-type multidrug transport system fused ATPase/permease subunit
MSYLGRDKWLLALAALFELVWVAANSIGLALSVRVIMNGAELRDVSMVFNGAKYIVAVVVLEALFDPAAGYLVSLSSERASRNLRVKVFGAALNATAAYLDAHESGDTISRLVNDVETAKQGYSTLQNAVNQVLQIILSLTALLVWSWPVAVSVLGFAALCFVSGAVFAKPVKTLSLRYQAALARVTESATNILSGVAMVKSLEAEKTVSDRFGAVTEEHLSVGRKRATVLGLQNGVMNAVPWLALSGLVIVTGSRVFARSLSAGDAVALVQLATRSIFPFTNLGNVWATLQQNLAAVDRVDEALRIPQENLGVGDGTPSAGVAASSTAGGITRPAPSIEFDHVGFSYGNTRVLSDVSFVVPGGSKMALAGASGSGKSTILKLILGMYAPETGTLRVAGQTLRDMPLSGLRRMIALVPQDAWLFPGTVRDNILFGRGDASEEEILAAARAANAHEFIEALPCGYDTVLDERGGNLSGGQRQRLCLARSFLKDAPVLFLDEPTSAVDAESELLISEAVERLSQGRTVITVAHSAKMLEGADVTVYLDGGKAHVSTL